VNKAKQRGFEIRFVYVYVDTLERQLERIRFRVVKGGHDVPADKVAARRGRSFRECPWFFWQAHQAWIFDNSGAEPKLVGWKETEHLAEFSGEMIEELFDEFRDPDRWR